MLWDDLWSFAKHLKNNESDNYNKMCNGNGIFGIYRVEFDHFIDGVEG